MMDIMDIISSIKVVGEFDESETVIQQYELELALCMSINLI